MVRASCPLIIKDGQDAHPTKLGNLFFGVPLDTEKRPLDSQKGRLRIWKIKDLLIAQLSLSLFVLAHKITQGTFHN